MNRRKAAGGGDETEEADGRQAGERMLLPTRRAHSANELTAGKPCNSSGTVADKEQAGGWAWPDSARQVTLEKSERLK